MFKKDYIIMRRGRVFSYIRIKIIIQRIKTGTYIKTN